MNWCYKFAITVITLTLQISSASVVCAEADFSIFTTKYLDFAFSDVDAKLHKFENVNPLDYEIDCASYNQDKCKPMDEFFSFSIFPNPNMQLAQGDQARLKVVYSDQNKLEVQKKTYAMQNSNGWSENDDLECQFYQEMSDSIIKSATIIVSVDASPQKIMNCLFFNFHRALGLNHRPNSNFSTAWRLEYERLHISKFNLLRRVFRMFQTIHSCPKLLAGMSYAEVKAELVEGSICFNNVFGD